MKKFCREGEGNGQNRKMMREEKNIMNYKNKKVKVKDKGGREGGIK